MENMQNNKRWKENMFMALGKLEQSIWHNLLWSAGVKEFCFVAFAFADLSDIDTFQKISQLCCKFSH